MSAGGIKPPETKSCLKISAIHVAPFLSVFFPRMTNESQVEEWFRQIGFEVVNPGKLALKQELEVFRQAKVVAGVVGAAFTNLLYYQPDARIFQFCPFEFQMSGAEAIADLCGQEFHYVCGEHTGDQEHLERVVHAFL